MMTEKSAGFILITDDFETDDYSVLLLHYTSGHWDYPKGNIETNETELEAATRELQEETGITLKISIPVSSCSSLVAASNSVSLVSIFPLG